jgi:hypothetical protein
VIVAPPVSDGADHDKLMAVWAGDPADSDKVPGAPGTSALVVRLGVLPSAPVPFSLIAATLKL